MAHFTKEEYFAMDSVEFRARFRERTHHTLEIQTYAAIHSGKSLASTQTKTVKELMEIWQEKGLSTELPDYKWGAKILSFAEKVQAGENVDLSEFAPHPISTEDYIIFQRILKERRSVRHWTDEKVPDEYIDKIMEAGLWGAHSCNLQSIRYLVVREENEPGLFRGSDIPGGPVHIVALQDERVYKANPLNPVRNRLIDVGAAMQNMVLEAHALGLGGVWLTFNTDDMIVRLRERFSIPEEIQIVSYIDVGFPAQTPSGPDRLSVEEAVLYRV